MINIQNTDENECLKSCLVKYLHPLATNLGRIRKIDIKFPVKIKDVHKIDKNCISVSIFGYENKETFPIYTSKNTLKKLVGLLLTK